MDPIVDILKSAQNANRSGAIFKRFISNIDRIILLECQFSLALVFVMRYVGRKKKSKKTELEESTKCDQCFKGDQIATSVMHCSQVCDSTAGNISSGIMNFLCMMLH